MRKSGTPTKYPGVWKIDEKTFRVRGKKIDPRTGKKKEVDRVVTDVTAQQAARIRAELLDELQWSAQPKADRVKVGEFAQSWMKSKALKLDSGTNARYAEALELHILPALGDFYYDALTTKDVQAWIDRALTHGRKTRDGERQPYARSTVHAWFRVLRTMSRDAMDQLDLSRDPTARVTFPEESEPDQPNALTSEELTKFLEAMRKLYPHHYALTVLLAYTGLRFCHASALKWEDWDKERGVIRVARKQVRGRVGRVTRKKQAPREYPVEPQLASVLDEHWRHMVMDQMPGLEEGWMFPSAVGTLRTPSGLYKAWKRCLDEAGITKRFTVHGMRYTFTDMVRLANVDAVVRRALTGHVTETMQQHYSTVGLAEKRAAVAGVYRLVPVGPPGGDGGGDQHSEGSHRANRTTEKRRLIVAPLRSSEGDQSRDRREAARKVGTWVGTDAETINGRLTRES